MGLTSLRPSTEKKGQPKSFKRKLKKLRFHAKVKDAAVSLSVKKAISKKKRLRSRQKKLKAYDLSALSEFLPDLDAPQHPSKVANNLKLNCKSRQKLVQREGAQLRAVLGNPAFQIDPLSAIHQHLERTQPPPIVVTQDKQQTGKKRGKGKRKPTRGPSQSMEI